MDDVSDRVLILRHKFEGYYIAHRYRTKFHKHRLGDFLGLYDRIWSRVFKVYHVGVFFTLTADLKRSGGLLDISKNITKAFDFIWARRSPKRARSDVASYLKKYMRKAIHWLNYHGPLPLHLHSKGEGSRLNPLAMFWATNKRFMLISIRLLIMVNMWTGNPTSFMGGMRATINLYVSLYNKLWMGGWDGSWLAC